MIQTYHGHIYFSLDEMALATQVRENIIKELPQLTYAGQLIPPSLLARTPSRCLRFTFQHRTSIWQWQR
jgi:hypothetical protein